MAENRDRNSDPIEAADRRYRAMRPIWEALASQIDGESWAWRDDDPAEGTFLESRGWIAIPNPLEGAEISVLEDAKRMNDPDQRRAFILLPRNWTWEDEGIELAREIGLRFGKSGLALPGIFHGRIVFFLHAWIMEGRLMHDCNCLPMEYRRPEERAGDSDNRAFRPCETDLI